MKNYTITVNGNVYDVTVEEDRSRRSTCTEQHRKQHQKQLQRQHRKRQQEQPDLLK